MKADDRSDSGSRDELRRRALLIEQCLATLSKTWVANWLQEMSTARRSLQGGWPGRLAEARALAVTELTRQLAATGMAPPSASELASAPAIVNAQARKEWLLAIKTRRLELRVAGAASDGNTKR